MQVPLRVLIVEDELLIRMGIKLSSDWNALGMRVVEDVADGESAWAAYQNLRPDVLLVDIRIPGMSGTELVRRIRQRDDLCRIIAITCVDEFQTIHQLTHYGITDYLLKVDMTPESLFSTLEKARREWEQLKHANPNPGGDTTHEECPPFEPAALIALYSEQFGDVGSEMILPTLTQLLSEQLPGELLCAVEGKGRAHCALSQIPQNYPESLARVQAHFKRVFGASLCAAGTVPRTGESADDAHNRLNRLTDDGYWFSKPIARFEPDEAWIEVQKAEIHCFFEHNRRRYDGIPETILETLGEQTARLSTRTVDEWRDGLVDLTLHILLRMLRLSMVDAASVSDTLKSAPTAVRSLEQCLLILEQEIYRHLTDRVKRGEIRKAIDYINRHFAQSLSASDVAKHVGLSAHYFLNVFKKETGMTFVGYINHFRIEHAKSLLEDTSLYAYEIASRCGFSDAAYFSRIFKQITGSHPSSYRQSSVEKTV